jgi:hypothetical protein
MYVFILRGYPFAPETTEIPGGELGKSRRASFLCFDKV